MLSLRAIKAATVLFYTDKVKLNVNLIMDNSQTVTVFQALVLGLCLATAVYGVSSLLNFLHVTYRVRVVCMTFAAIPAAYYAFTLWGMASLGSYLILVSALYYQDWHEERSIEASFRESTARYLELSKTVQ